jgi:hypothetical protein
MLSWPNIMYKFDWNLCETRLSRQIWCNMRIRTDDRGWCHDLIWADILKGTDEIWCGFNQITIAISIRKDVKAIFHDQFEVLCGLEEIIEDDILT